MTAETIKVGDRVIWFDGSGWSRIERSGSIVKLSASGKTAVVQPIGSGQARDFRIGKYGWPFRKETADERAVRVWKASCPSSKFVSARRGLDNSEPHGCHMHTEPTTPAEMRAAADELRAIADWFERRPKEKP